jgi:autotransporter translocation and assembly factor TamB
MIPMLVEVMKFGIGAFKQAEPIEGTLDAALEQMKAASQQPKQPQPDPEQMKMQAQQQSEQMKMQADAQAAQMKAQIDVQAQQARVQADMQIEQMKLQADAQLEQMRQQMKMQELQYLDQFNRYKAQLDSSTRIMVAEIGAKAQVDKVREAEEAANTEVAIVLGQA